MLFMSKIKAVCVFLLCVLFLTSCSPAKNDVQDLPVPSAVNYKTTVVKRGKFKLTEKSGGSFVYPVTYSLSCEYDHAVLKEEIAVHHGTAVKKGDVLATFTFDVSRAELEKLELAYREAVSMAEKENERYQSLIESYASQISEDPQGKIAALQKEQTENQWKLSQLNSSYQIEKAKSELENYREMFSEKSLIAPCDGIVSSVAALKVNREIEKNTNIVTLYAQDSVYFKVSSPTKDMLQIASLNLPVVITSGTWSSSGHIAATPTGIENVLDNQNLYIQIDHPQGIPLNGSPAVECTALELKNMLLLDRSAVRSDASLDYVLILENGASLKRNVLCGPANNDVICILDGLSEGQQVILN